MSTLPITELTTRARDIFRLVVEEYLSSGQPVGSRTLAGGGQVNLSPASIRSVLAELETLGLLAAPHTSAGRMPTDMGLRLFVDGMMQVAEPTAEERAAIERRLTRPGPIEQALEATSMLLSDLSAAAGVVMVPRREPRLAQMNLVPLAPGTALAVLVGEDGHIENRLLELPPGLPLSALEQLHHRPSCRAHAGGSRARDGAGNRLGPVRAGQRQPRSGGARPCRLERGCDAAAGADRPRAGQPAGRNGLERSRTRPPIARRP
jgi:heat-inducible transcriptional repressor